MIGSFFLLLEMLELTPDIDVDHGKTRPDQTKDLSRLEYKRIACLPLFKDVFLSWSWIDRRVGVKGTILWHTYGKTLIYVSISIQQFNSYSIKLETQFEMFVGRWKGMGEAKKSPLKEWKQQTEIKLWQLN